MASNLGTKQQEGKKSKSKHSKHGGSAGKEKNFLNLSIPGEIDLDLLILRGTCMKKKQ